MAVVCNVVSAGDDEELVTLEDHTQTTVTATVHDKLTLTCRLGDHNSHDEVTWYRDRCVRSDVCFTQSRLFSLAMCFLPLPKTLFFYLAFVCLYVFLVKGPRKVGRAKSMNRYK